MKHWKLGEVCEHGRLGRQCPECERDDEIAEITDERDRYRAALRTIARQSPGCGGCRDLALEALEEVKP